MSTSTTIEKSPRKARLIVVLDMATLEIVKVSKSSGSRDSQKDAKYHLLNCDDHQSILKKNRKDDASLYRPDITHQCLLTLLDSPLNKAGLLSVYIRTQKNVLIEVNPKTRIPRTFTRFAGLMVQLLHKLSIKSTAGGEVLLNVIKNPITDHLPMPCIKVGFSHEAPVVRLSEWVRTDAVAPDIPVVCFVGAMSHGQDSFKDAEHFLSISNYPLSASVACGKICDAFEELWNVL